MKKSSILCIAIATVAITNAAQADKLVISEVLYNEVGSSYTGEWIEIYNGTGATIDLSNYKIGDEETQFGIGETEIMSLFPQGASIAPGETQIISSFASRFGEVYGFRPNYEYGSSNPADGWIDDELVPNMVLYTGWDTDGAKLNMSNTNDQLLFLDQNDEAVDFLNWGNNFFFNPGLAATTGDGQSYARIVVDIDTDTAADWALTDAAPEAVYWTTRSTPGTINIADIEYTSDEDGDIADTSRHTATVVNNYGRTLRFGSTITADRSVTISADTAAYALQFDNANASYTVAGTGRILLGSGFGGGKINVVAGSHTISAPLTFSRTTNIDVADGSALAITGPLDATGSAVTKTGAGTVTLPGLRSDSLTINEGIVAIAAGNGDAATSVVNTLSIAAGATLDLNDAALVVRYDAESASPFADIVAAVKDGRLVSTIAASDNRKAIGVIDVTNVSGTFRGVEVDGPAVLADLTLRGDTNLDSLVNFNDLLALAQNYGTTESATWGRGDTNYDGAVNFNDLLALAQNYGGSAGDALIVGGSADFQADWALAQSLVPEPTTLGLIGAAMLVGGRRRR